jgi:hypothetical protein
MKKNKNIIIILLVIILLLITGYFILNTIFNSKSKSGAIDLSKDNNDPINIELNLADYKDTANIKLTGNLNEGAVTIEILNSNNKIIGTETIDNHSTFTKNFKINKFGSNIRIVILKHNAIGTVKYSVKNK